MGTPGGTPMSIHQFYYLRLGREPRDTTLRDLPLNSLCGLDCAQVIIAMATLLPLCDKLVHDQLHEAAQRAISIKWRG